VRNAFAILQAFRSSDDWLTSRELSQRVSLPKSSGHRLILTLEAYCSGLGKVLLAALSVTGDAAELPAESWQAMHGRLTAASRSIAQKLAPNQGR
jgi:DNA-binding IclR family transcriptional regulator